MISSPWVSLLVEGEERRWEDENGDGDFLKMWGTKTK